MKGVRKMPLISKVPEIVTREYKVEDYVATAVENYARMIESTSDHVVNSALKMVLFKDKDYSRWRKNGQETTGGKNGVGHAPARGPKS
jgi:hypothetical protein